MKRILDFLLPPSCALCSARVLESASLCSDCWQTINFMTTPLCDRCGIPFEITEEGPMICSPCLSQPPRFHRHRSALYYDDYSKPLIMRFKHNDGLHLTPLFSRWLALAGQSLLQHCDALVPVPLHWRRLFGRRYNQSALLAHALSRTFHKMYLPQALHRQRYTPSQGTKTIKERHQNLQGAIRAGRGQKGALKGKRIVLIDDVYTSGATIHECVKVLLKQNVDSVSVLTLARVVRNF